VSSLLRVLNETRVSQVLPYRNLTYCKIPAFSLIEFMYIVPIAWLYVALMMAVAEATNTNGTLLGAVMTFIFYGLAPVALVVYLMRAPGRRRAVKSREAAELAALAEFPASDSSSQPDAGRHAAADTITSMRKEP
jgi:hypothetical protein